MLERAIVGRRLAFDDAEIVTKYTFPFVDSAWQVAFTVIDRIGGPPRVFDGAIRVDGGRLRASDKTTKLRPVESFPVDRFERLVHFDPWWAFRGVSGVDRRWIEAIFATNIARPFAHKGRPLKLHDLRFADGLRSLIAVIAKDAAFRPVEFHRGEIDVLTLRKPHHPSRQSGHVEGAKAL